MRDAQDGHLGVDSCQIDLDRRIQEACFGGYRPHVGQTTSASAAACCALATAAHEGDVADVDLEAVPRPQGFSDGRPASSADLPRCAASGAAQVAVVLRREDVELLAAIGGVAVPNQPELLEHVKRAIDGRRNGRWLARSTALDEIRTRDVIVDPGKDLDDRAPLRRPAEATLTQPIGDGVPRGGEHVDGHRG